LEFDVAFQHKYGYYITLHYISYSEWPKYKTAKPEKTGVENYPYPVKEGQ